MSDTRVHPSIEDEHVVYVPFVGGPADGSRMGFSWPAPDEYLWLTPVRVPFAERMELGLDGPVESRAYTLARFSRGGTARLRDVYVPKGATEAEALHLVKTAVTRNRLVL